MIYVTKAGNKKGMIWITSKHTTKTSEARKSRGDTARELKTGRPSKIKGPSCFQYKTES
jgi:hypothetical protein